MHANFPIYTIRTINNQPHLNINRSYIKTGNTTFRKSSPHTDFKDSLNTKELTPFKNKVSSKSNFPTFRILFLFVYSEIPFSGELDSQNGFQFQNHRSFSSGANDSSIRRAIR